MATNPNPVIEQAKASYSNQHKYAHLGGKKLRSQSRGVLRTKMLISRFDRQVERGTKKAK